jgi:hypothetical protein
MSSLAGKTLFSTYTSLLKLEGDTQALVAGGGTAIQIKTGDNEATPIYLNTDRVGIGTASPGHKLDVEETSGTDYAAQIKHTVANAAGLLIEAGSAATNPILTLKDKDGNQKAVFRQDGKVGIGTATPNQKLTVEGTMSMKEQADDGADVASYSQIWVKNTGDGILMFTDDNGTQYTVDVTAV